MAEFLTTSMTVALIERLIDEARTSLVFISPYVQISETIHQRMLDASRRKVAMTFVFGKNDMKSDEYNALRKIPGLNLYYFENLHAKCYYNEDKLIISSMNLYEYSSRNREMGVLLERLIDKELYTKAIEEAMSIIRHAEKYIVGNDSRGSDQFKNGQKSIYPTDKLEMKDAPSMSSIRGLSVHTPGNCIRCFAPISLDGAKPYCNKCFRTWSQFENPNYPEKHCHGCSTPTETSMAKPFCSKCYKRLSN